MCAARHLAVVSPSAGKRTRSASARPPGIHRMPGCNDTRHDGPSVCFLDAAQAATILAMSKGPEKRDIRFSMRIPDTLHKRLKRASDADRRTMADFTIIALERALDEFEAAQAGAATAAKRR